MRIASSPSDGRKVETTSKLQEATQVKRELALVTSFQKHEFESIVVTYQSKSPSRLINQDTQNP